MTLTIQTSLGKVRVTPVFKVSSMIRKKIENSLKSALETYEDASVLTDKIKKEIPWADSPRGSLVAYMTGQEWSQRRLSKKTGIPQGHLSQMISGSRPIGPKIARKLAKTLGVDYRKFL